MSCPLYNMLPPTIFPILSLYEEMPRRRYHLGEGEEEEQNCDYPRWHNREEYGSIDFFLKERFCFQVLLLLFSPIMLFFCMSSKYCEKILWKIIVIIFHWLTNCLNSIRIQLALIRNIMKKYCENLTIYFEYEAIWLPVKISFNTE